MHSTPNPLNPHVVAASWSEPVARYVAAGHRSRRFKASGAGQQAAFSQ